MYKIKNEIPNFVEFEKIFLYGLPLTQSLPYYEWNSSYGNKADFFTIYKAENQIGFFCIYNHKIFKNFKLGYIPYGPVLKEYSNELLLLIKKYLLKYASDNKLFAIDLDFTLPNFEVIQNLNSIFKVKARFQISNYIQPRTEWYINLNQSIENIFSQMHKNTRYSIKKSSEKGIEVIIEENNYQTYFDTFKLLMDETAKRNNFTPFNNTYYENAFKILESYNKNNSIIKSWLTITKFKDKILTISLFVGYDNVVYYLYSCSSNEHRDKYPVYASIWHTIKKAKELGYKYLNLGNVDYINEKKYSTLTLFKQRFGGDYVFHRNLCTLITDYKYYYIFDIYKKIKNFLKENLN